MLINFKKSFLLRLLNKMFTYCTKIPIIQAEVFSNCSVSVSLLENCLKVVFCKY